MEPLKFCLDWWPKLGEHMQEMKKIYIECDDSEPGAFNLYKTHVIYHWEKSPLYRVRIKNDVFFCDDLEECKKFIDRYEAGKT